MSNEVSMTFEAIWKTGPRSHFLEGPAISPDGQKVYFTDLWPGKVYSLPLNDLHADPELVHCFAPYRCNGLQFLSHEKKKIAVCVWKGNQLNPYSRTGAMFTLDLDESNPTPTTEREPCTLASGFKWPNDLAITPAGGIYFTDFAEGLVYYLSPKSKSPCIVLDKLSKPNGIELQCDSEHATVLFVAESGENRVRRYEIKRPGKVIETSSPYQFEDKTRVDGLALNSDGILLVAEKSAVYALNATNLTAVGCEPLRKTDAPVPSNICFMPDGSFIVTSYKFFKCTKAELFHGKFS